MSVNVPLTTWAPTDGHGEYANGGVFNIVDTVGVFLADTVGNLIVDTGALFGQVPTTLWSENGAL